MPGPALVGVLALHQVRDAAGELDHLDAALDVALGVGDGLAVLAGEAVGQLVVVARHQLEELHQHAGAALRVGGGPGRLRGLGVLDGGATSALEASGTLARTAPSMRLEDVAEAAGRALDVLAADEMREFCRHGDVSSEYRSWLLTAS